MPIRAFFNDETARNLRRSDIGITWIELRRRWRRGSSGKDVNRSDHAYPMRAKKKARLADRLPFRLRDVKDVCISRLSSTWNALKLDRSDPLVLDRWFWLKARLPKTRNDERLLDVGCGTGAFSIGATRRGYRTLGLSWDERNQSAAKERAVYCGASSGQYEVLDIRELDRRPDLVGCFDVVVCLETIEHVLEDLKLMRTMAGCMKPGGRLLLTTPYLLYVAISPGDNGPFSTVEDGWHVRRGYSRAMLEELCERSGLRVERITYCSGYVSQKVAAIMRGLSAVNSMLAWALVLPLRALPPIVDPIITRLLGWPHYSICLEAYKPRFPASQ
jgi:2-polyprenyl-3-methyl-5-hydroxy-6-metoxy-1,4-benzoquinol methylase